jgi:hypothetical protein
VIYLDKRKNRMGKRIFEIEAFIKYRIELDDEVIDVVDDEW